ncbi:hypothetical protein ACU5AX_04655 [Sphingomonas sp. XXL09]|uniref:hypothetical protein n=1 Tax=Sphingomonas sp. XXL09 TaxID=3457787 RepID=UPI00406BCC1D
MRKLMNGIAIVDAMIINAPASTYIQKEPGFADIIPAPNLASDSVIAEPTTNPAQKPRSGDPIVPSLSCSSRRAQNC